MHLCSESSLQFDSLYIGGGTPSILESEQIREIIETAYPCFQIMPAAEITIEINPGTVSLDKLKHYRSFNINRINIGIQSFQDAQLKFLGRIHSSKQAEISINGARKAGFENLGLDLIYGIPGQTVKSWLSDLKRAVEFEPEHLSCYMLTYESGTPMEIDLQKGCFTPLSESFIAELYLATISFLNARGYIQYEISNFAKSKSNRSRHNRKYWSFAPYIGLGPSAHSYLEPCRRWNHRCLKSYIKDLAAGCLPIAGQEILTQQQQMIEVIYLGLRQTDGIALDEFEKKFGVGFEQLFADVLSFLKERGFIRPIQTHCALLPEGMLLLDSITSMFVEQIPYGFSVTLIGS